MEVGETLRKHLRPYDLLVRFGGDEFLCLLPNTSSQTATERLQQVATELAARKKATGISYGLAELASSGDTFEELLSRADENLFAGRRLTRGASKAAGGESATAH